MIIVSGLQRKTGQVRTQTFLPGQEGAARNFRAQMRSTGYNTVFVNDVAARYAATPSQREEVQPFAVAGITGYQLHSLGTASGHKKDNHITKCVTDTLTEAIEEAEKLIGKWSNGHKGIVIYRAIKLVRKITKPTTEIVELS